MLEGIEDDYDFAAWLWPRGKNKGHVMTGTLWLNNTATAIDILEQWNELEQLANENVRVGQRNLTCAIKNVQPRVLRLDQGYCKIRTMKWITRTPEVFRHETVSLRDGYGDITTSQSRLSRMKRQEMALEKKSKL